MMCKVNICHGNFVNPIVILCALEQAVQNY